MRRALCAAIDRQAVLQAGQNGLGTPIGSYYTPGSPGYVDLTGVNAYDPDKARQLLKEALPDGPLSLTLTLPPTPYARQGGEVVVAQLAQAGVRVKVQKWNGRSGSATSTGRRSLTSPSSATSSRSIWATGASPATTGATKKIGRAHV